MPAPDPYLTARNTPGAGLKDTEEQIDMARMRAYRLGRVREQLARYDFGACVLFDPINIRYATGTRNMALWTQHSPDRYVFVPAEGPVILFDREVVWHQVENFNTVDELRKSIRWYYEVTGPRVDERAQSWADEISDLMHQHCGDNRRLAIDRIGPAGIVPLQNHGISMFEAQEPLEQARVIKSDDEIACMCISITACETGMARMHEALRPGLTENALWSILHQTNIEMGGEWMETRLLSSGGRTNPWYQECGDKIIRAGELVAFDADMIGPFSYCADISRTFFCEPGKPTAEQRRLYQHAYEQVHHNIELLKVGVSFREFSEMAWKIPDEFVANRYGPAHGIGLADEYPDLPDAMDWERSGYDGVLEADMTFCIESYIGAVGGAEGVKLEQQVLVTADGPQVLSSFPFEDALLA